LEEVIINYYYYTGERRVNVGGAGGKGKYWERGKGEKS